MLVRAGQTVDISLDVTNPGLWMAHCHIAEHTESGMMFSFEVSGPLAPVRQTRTAASANTEQTPNTRLAISDAWAPKSSDMTV